ncbi:MAG: Unknown protein, partial [uncultured Aureispira sp.]
DNQTNTIFQRSNVLTLLRGEPELSVATARINKGSA